MVALDNLGGEFSWAEQAEDRNRWNLWNLWSCNLTSTTWQVVEGAAQCKPRKYGFCAW